MRDTAAIVELVRRIDGWERVEPTVAPLPGGITNRNYRVDIEGHSYVVRIPGERTELLGIDRVGEAEASRRAAALGLAPPVHAELPVVGTLVTQLVPGHPATTAELVAPGMLEDLAASIRRFHTSGSIDAQFPVFRVVEWHARDVAAHGGRVPTVYDELHRVAGRIEQAFAYVELVPCHNDLLPANVLLSPERHWLIDFEYAGMNEALFDLANLSVNCGFDETADRRLLAAYDGDPSDPRLARLDLMKVMSELREGMWAVVQQVLSTLGDVDFATYASQRLEHCLELSRSPALDTWLAEAAR